MTMPATTQIRMKPTTPAIVTPMIKEVSGPLLDEVGEVEAVEAGTFPTVDSGRFEFEEDIVAFTILNMSALTTSKYAHPGTAVAVLITFGYLSSGVNYCLKINERSNGRHTWIVRSLNYRNLRTIWTT